MSPILVPILSLILVSPAPGTPTLKQQIQGTTWRLVSYESSTDSGRTWFKRLGDGPKGYIMYDATGHMMVAFEKMPPPPKFASDDDWKPSAEEALRVYSGFVAYFGTYTIDESVHAVTHHVEGSLNPSYFGTNQVRPATLDGDRLTLSDGKNFRVVWEKVR